MNQEEIIRLTEQCRLNDKKAFRQIVEHYQGMIYALAFRNLGNYADAEDVVQDTFIRAWLNLNKYQPDKKFESWLYAIAYRLCLDKLRSKHYRTQQLEGVLELSILSSDADTERTVTDAETANIIRVITGKLSPKQKLLFTLKYIEELNTNEISTITGLPADKIKSNLYVALRSIRETLKKHREHGNI